ncbi:hypothetical protein HOD20_08385 [archaeon]|nr:hypothetical protein [archaeon]MBT4647752.1 hypothetical protein [archaeon]
MVYINKKIVMPEALKKDEFRFALGGRWNSFSNKKEFKIFEPKSLEEFKKLEKEGWRPQGKAPIEKGWNRDKNYRHDDELLIKHLGKGKNYLTLFGPGNLRGLDLDIIEKAEEFDGKMNTLTIASGKGRHYLINTDYDINHDLTIGEFRAKGEACVGPGSLYPVLGKEYKIIKDVPIKTYSKEEILNIIKPYIIKKKSNDYKDILKEFDEFIVELFHDEHGIPFAKIRVSDHTEVLSLNSKQFRNFLLKKLFDKNKKILPEQKIKSIINVLHAKAIFDGKERKVHIRSALLDDSIYIDTCDKNWRVIKVSKESIEIIKDSPVIFRRYGHMKQLKFNLDAEIKDLKRLFKFIPVSEEDKLLIETYVSGLLYPDIPYAILLISGPQGSAKSTSQRIIRMIADPSSLPTLSISGSKKEMIQQLSHHYISFYDNVRAIKANQSDLFCRAVTGEGFSKRELFSDDDDIIYHIKRKIGFNGINLPSEHADFLDRSLIIMLERIDKKKRMQEKELMEEFHKNQPYITGAILKVLQKTLIIKDTIKLDNVPRMADFAHLSESISQALGYEPSTFINKYWKKIGYTNISALQADSIALAVYDLIKRKSGKWEGTATQLLEELEHIAENLKIKTNNAYWPKAPNALSRRLKTAATTLHEEGISIDTDRNADSRNIVIIDTSSENPVEIVEDYDDNDGGDDSDKRIINWLGIVRFIEEEDKGEGITTDYILDNAQHKHWTAWALLDLQKDGKIIQIKPNVWKVVK